MNPADNIERAVEQLHITTRPETDKRILDDAFAALEKSAQKQSPHVGRSARRRTLRIRIAELAAVAAVEGRFVGRDRERPEVLGEIEKVDGAASSLRILTVADDGAASDAPP